MGQITNTFKNGFDGLKSKLTGEATTGATNANLSNINGQNTDESDVQGNDALQNMARLANNQMQFQAQAAQINFAIEMAKTVSQALKDSGKAVSEMAKQ
jgi:hypothetical protein